jgi:hypothetical protein
MGIERIVFIHALTFKELVYSDFHLNEPHYFYLTQRRKGAKEEKCGLNT